MNDTFEIEVENNVPFHFTVAHFFVLMSVQMLMFLVVVGGTLIYFGRRFTVMNDQRARAANDSIYVTPPSDESDTVELLSNEIETSNANANAEEMRVYAIENYMCRVDELSTYDFYNKRASDQDKKRNAIVQLVERAKLNAMQVDPTFWARLQAYKERSLADATLEFKR